MGSYTGTPPSLLSGELADADKLVEITNFMTAMTSSWTPFTPTGVASAGTWARTGASPGTLAGRYQRIGKTVEFWINYLAGATDTFGTAGAYWVIGAPPLGNVAANFSLACRLFDTGVLEYGALASIAAGGSTFELFKPVSGRVLNNSPFTFGSGDSLWFNGKYELA